MPTSRDKLLTFILPAMLVLLVYTIFVTIPHLRAMSGLEKSLQAAQASVPSQAMYQAQQQQLIVLRKELEQIGTEEKVLSKVWTEMTHSCLDAATRSNRLTRLMALLSKHQIHVLHHGPLESSGEVKTLRLSRAQERLAKLISERDNKLMPQVWRLHVSGRYSDVVQALQSLNAGDSYAIPLGLTMKEVLPSSSVHEWWVLLWI